MHTTALCSPSRGAHPDRSEPPLAGVGHDRRDLDRLPGLQRDPAVRQGHAERDAAAARLQHVPGRQVASVAARARDAGRAVRPLAARARVRAVLRVPRRRHQPVVSRARLRQPLGRAAGAARGRLPPERRPGRPGDRVHPGRPRQRPGQAVLPALLHRRRPRAAPRPDRVGRQVQGQVRRRLGRVPHDGPPASARHGHHPGRHRAVRARPGRARVGHPAGRRPARCSRG